MLRCAMGGRSEAGVEAGAHIEGIRRCDFTWVKDGFAAPVPALSLLLLLLLLLDTIVLRRLEERDQNSAKEPKEERPDEKSELARECSV